MRIELKPCPTCDGYGSVPSIDGDRNRDTCYHCHGTGSVSVHAAVAEARPTPPDSLVRIVIVPCHGKPFVAWVKPDLDTFQAIVGGMIEVVRNRVPGTRVDIVCNEEGIMTGLPQNGCGLLGNYYFCAIDGNGDERSLTDQEVAAALAYWTARRTQPHPDPNGENSITYFEVH
jgi:hypothetical protein